MAKTKVCKWRGCREETYRDFEYCYGCYLYALLKLVGE